MKINSLAETMEYGKKIADMLKPGDILCLSGNLGAGKTTMSKTIIKELGVTDTVTSPTFTIVHEYQGRLPVYHFDVYRIDDIEEMYEIGYEEYFFGEGVCIIEWAEKIEEIIPAEAMHITIEYGNVSQNDEERIIKTEKI